MFIFVFNCSWQFLFAFNSYLFYANKQALNVISYSASKIVKLCFQLEQVPFLWDRYEQTSGSTPLLFSPKRRDAAVPDLRQPRIWGSPDRSGVHNHWEPLPHIAWQWEAVVALSWVRSEEWDPVHAWSAWPCPAARPGEGLQDVWEDIPFLAGGQRRHSPTRIATGDGGHH